MNLIDVCVVEQSWSDVSNRTSESRHSDECQHCLFYSNGLHSDGCRLPILLDILVVLSINASNSEWNHSSPFISVR